MEVEEVVMIVEDTEVEEEADTMQDTIEVAMTLDTIEVVTMQATTEVDTIEVVMREVDMIEVDMTEVVTVNVLMVADVVDMLVGITMDMEEVSL
jgi:hypothetical protein